MRMRDSPHRSGVSLRLMPTLLACWSGPNGEGARGPSARPLSLSRHCRRRSAASCCAKRQGDSGGLSSQHGDRLLRERLDDFSSPALTHSRGQFNEALRRWFLAEHCELSARRTPLDQIEHGGDDPNAVPSRAQARDVSVSAGLGCSCRLRDLACQIFVEATGRAPIVAGWFNEQYAAMLFQISGDCSVFDFGARQSTVQQALQPDRAPRRDVPLCQRRHQRKLRCAPVVRRVSSILLCH
jgi:hypothetical protein